jgi:GDP-4-dehydro-6-deoxy-D-mannose reductase
VRVAVSGVNGFVGQHLVRELVSGGHEVLGTSNGPVEPSIETLLATYSDQDLTVAWPAQDVDAVVHLAGLSAVGPSFDAPQSYIHGNSAPVTQLCEHLLRTQRPVRVVVVSTGAVYAPGTRLDEGAPTEPSSPYAVSKLLVETQCAYYRRRGVDVMVMRPFNHVGPGQQAGFLLPDLIAGLAEGSLTVGNLDTRRDYTDVRDVARAYRLAVEADPLDVSLLNVCSARSVSGLHLLRLVVDELGIEEPEVAVDRSRLRPDDPAEISGDNSLIGKVLGWAPEIDLETTVRDTVAELAARP